jgi:hypothetical protein
LVSCSMNKEVCKQNNLCYISCKQIMHNFSVLKFPFLQCLF